MSANLCPDCGWPLTSAVLGGERKKEAGECGALVHPYWADECNWRTMKRLRAQLADLEQELQREKLQLALALRGAPLAEARRECEAWRALAEYAAKFECLVGFARRAAAIPDSVWCNGRNGHGVTFGVAVVDLALKLKLIPEKA